MGRTSFSMLIKVFDIYPTEEAALESFAKPPKLEA